MQLDLLQSHLIKTKLKKHYDSIYEELFINEKKENIEYIGKKENSGKTLERLVLNVTNVCNLKCAYCYACGGSYQSDEGVMSLDTAIKSIDTFYGYFDHIELLQFFGGEPLINLEVIEGVCKHIIEKNKLGKIKTLPMFGICTNGTLLNEKAIDIIEKYNINVTASVDGAKNIHDLNRYYNCGEGTYDIIIKNLNALYKRTGQPTTIEVTYNQRHVMQGISIKDIVEHLNPMFPTTAFHIVPVSTENDQLKLKNRDAFIDSVDDIFDTLEKDTAYTYSLVQRLIDALRYKRYSDFICPAGLGTLSVDIKGNIYPCFMFTDIENLKMGNVYEIDVFTGERLKKIQNLFLENDKASDEKCKDCLLQRFCCGCHGMNYFNNKKIGNYEENFCNMNIQMAQKVLIDLSDYVDRIS